MNNGTSILRTHVCARCSKTIPPCTMHVRMTIQMMTGAPDVRRYCTDCCQDPALAVLLSDVCNNPVKRIDVFVCYR